MIPNMYKMAGELRLLYSMACSCFGNQFSVYFRCHQDVMATRQTGFALLAEGSVQKLWLAECSNLSRY